MMESLNIDHLKDLRERKIISEASYIRSVIDFAKKFVEKDMKLEVLKVVEREKYGGVFIAREPGATVKLAVKTVVRDKISSEEDDVWPSLKHPNVLRLLDKLYVARMDACIFVTEHCQRSLHTYLKNDFRQDRNAAMTVRHVLQDVLEGLGYLHERGYSYLNIKPKNVLMSAGNVAVLTDFTSVQTVEEIPKRIPVPRSYGPPEVFFRNHPDITVRGGSHDIWSFGILALNIFTNFYLQRKLTENADWEYPIYPTLHRLLERPRFRRHLKLAFSSCRIQKAERSMKLNLIIMCLRIAPMERPSVDLLLRHKYFMPEGGFICANKGPWAKRIKVMTAGWIDIINPRIPESDIFQAKTPTENSESDSSDDSNDEENGESNDSLKNLDPKAYFPLISSQSKDNSAPQRTNTQRPKSSKSNDQCNLSQNRKKGANHKRSEEMSSKATILKNTPKATTAENKMTHEDSVPEAIDDGKSETKSPSYDDFSAAEVIRFLQPKVFAIEGSNQKFSKWLTYELPGKRKSPSVDKNLLSSKSSSISLSETGKVVDSIKGIHGQTFENCPEANLMHETTFNDKKDDGKLLEEASILKRRWYPRGSDEALHALRCSECVLQKCTESLPHDKETPTVKDNESVSISESTTTNDSNSVSKGDSASGLNDVLDESPNSPVRVQPSPVPTLELRKLLSITHGKIMKKFKKKLFKDVKNKAPEESRTLAESQDSPSKGDEKCSFDEEINPTEPCSEEGKIQSSMKTQVGDKMSTKPTPNLAPAQEITAESVHSPKFNLPPNITKQKSRIDDKNHDG